jgi:hypothetical protein
LITVCSKLENAGFSEVNPLKEMTRHKLKKEKRKKLFNAGKITLDLNKGRAFFRDNNAVTCVIERK